MAALMISMLMGCRSSPSQDTRSAKPEDVSMTETVPSFPQGDQVPPIARMAELLASAVPQADRARAEKLLTEHILPAQLADLASHPQPLKLARAVYQRLAAELDETPADQRMAALEDRVQRTRFQRLDRHALSLAIARYLLDHPDAAQSGKLDTWINPTVSTWRARSRDELTAEAEATLEQVQRLQDEIAASTPALWNQLRASFLRTRMALGSARTGSFETAAGPLADFLRAAGETPAPMDFH
jgi:hypothetical protein